MTGALDRNLLLGTSRLAPPAALARGARFSTPEAYAAFLDQTLREPAAYWGTLAGELRLAHPPTATRDAGGWFPGAHLNLAEVVLGDPRREAVALEVFTAGATGSHSVTRAHLRAATHALAARIAGWNLASGDRVLLAVTRGADLVVATLACAHLGLVPIADDPLRADAGRIGRRALAAGCQAAILGEEALAGERRLDPETLPVLHRLVLEAAWDREAPADPVPGGPASVVSAASDAGFIFGDASGRLYSVSRLGLALQGISSYRFLLDGRGEGDRHLVITPLHHSSFVVAALGAILTGGTLVLLEGGLRVESGPALVADVIRTGARVAVLQARHLTRIQASLTPDPATGAGPEIVVLEGEAVTPGLYQAVRQAFASRPSHVTQVVSRPESGGYLAGPYPPVCPVRPAAAGLSAPGLPLLIVDDHGKPCPESHGGFVAIAQAVPSLAVELSAQPLPVTIGVRARRDRDGLLWTVGEVQMEVAEVEPVSAPEIEAHVASLDGVHEVAVVRSHPADGRPRTWVFARLDPERIDVARIRTAIVSHLGERAAPDAIYAVERLPYSRSGKLLRTVLKRIAVGDTAGLDGEGLVADPDAVQQLILRCQGGEGTR